MRYAVSSQVAFVICRRDVILQLLTPEKEKLISLIVNYVISYGVIAIGLRKIIRFGHLVASGTGWLQNFQISSQFGSSRTFLNDNFGGPLSPSYSHGYVKYLQVELRICDAVVEWSA